MKSSYIPRNPYHQCPCCHMALQHFDNCPLKDKSMRQAEARRNGPDPCGDQEEAKRLNARLRKFQTRNKRRTSR